MTTHSPNSIPSSTAMSSSAPSPKSSTNVLTKTFSKLKEIVDAQIRALIVPKPNEPSLKASAKAIAKSSYLNILVALIPVSWALYFARPDLHIAIFITSFIAIIPLAALLGFATEEISLRLGQTTAGLLNATLGNAVELIVAIIALLKCELTVVQSSLVGSVLSNLLLVLGMCFVAGGTRFMEQGFSIGAAQISASLLVISTFAVLIPSVIFASLKFSSTSAPQISSTIMKLSHAVAVILLVIYFCYLWFQLRSHSKLFDDSEDNVAKSIAYERMEKKPTSLPPTSAPEAEQNKAAQDTEEAPQINKLAAILLLVITTGLVAITSEALVDSINGIASTGVLSKEFIGLILLPIVSNAAEHFTAVTVSVKDKLNLSISIAVGSSIQIALFVIPFIVTLAWILGKPLPMVFDPFETAVLFFAVMTVNYTIQDGRANYLEGTILIALFIIIATASFFYTGIDITGIPSTCT